MMDERENREIEKRLRVKLLITLYRINKMAAFV